MRTGASLPASAAREQNIVDVIAVDVPDLLRKIDGRSIQTPAGTVVLMTRGATIERLEADWRTQLLAVLTNPNVALLLMMAGVYGLVLEASNPGSLVPGIVGVICVLLALYAFQVLSVNFAGLGLMLVGLALIVAEAFVPAYGALGIGGITALVIGSIVLWDRMYRASILRAGYSAALLWGGTAMLITMTYFTRPAYAGGDRSRIAVTGNRRRAHGLLATRVPFKLLARDGLL